MSRHQSAYEYRIWVVAGDGGELRLNATVAAAPASPLARLLALAVEMIREQQAQGAGLAAATEAAVVISAMRRVPERNRNRLEQAEVVCVKLPAPMLDLLPTADKAVIEPLSVREHEVLMLVAQGAPNSEIADILTLSLHTVKRHTSSILAKLNASNRTQAVAYARAYGMLAEPNTSDSKHAQRRMA